MNSSHRLTSAQQPFYRENGYLPGLPPIYSRAEMAQLKATPLQRGPKPA